MKRVLILSAAMFLFLTNSFPYGISRMKQQPAGLINPVQSLSGSPSENGITAQDTLFTVISRSSGESLVRKIKCVHFCGTSFAGLLSVIVMLFVLPVFLLCGVYIFCKSVQKRAP